MKILLLIDSLGFGGAQRQIVNLAVSLKECGHDVMLLRYREDDFYRPLLQKAKIEPMLVKRKNSISRMYGLRKKIKEIAPDVLISFMTAPNFYACMASIGKHSWKVIVSERVANETAFINKKLKPILKIQSKYADAIICNSKCAADLWEKYYPETKAKLDIIYNIIDIPNTVAEEKTDEKCRLLVAARYEKEKNLDGMLEAVNLLSDDERARLEIHWYGKANIVEATESVFDRGVEFIKQNHLENCVFLHQATDKIYDVMVKADYLSLFSHREGLSNSIIEGMTLKKPIVMSKVSDYDVLVDESNGFLCDPTSSEDIANAIRAAINTTEAERQEMGAASYKKIQTICSRKAVVDHWDDLIKSI